MVESNFVHDYPIRPAQAARRTRLTFILWMLASFAVPVGVVAILRVRGGWGNLVKADEVLLLLFSASIIAGIDSLYYNFEVRTRRNLLLFFLALAHLLSTIALALIYSNVTATGPGGSGVHASASAAGASVSGSQHTAIASGSALGVNARAAVHNALGSEDGPVMPDYPADTASHGDLYGVLGVYWVIAAASFVICAWYKWANTKTVEDSTIQLPVEIVNRLDKAIREKDATTQARLRSEFLLIAVRGGSERSRISPDLIEILFAIGAEELVLEKHAWNPSEPVTA